MEIDVRPFDGEPREFLEAAEIAFSDRVRDEDVEPWEATFEADRAIAACDGERIVGTAGVLSFELTVPGGVLPAAGVTMVGVQPTHRRRGILRRMMRDQLDAIHDRGEPVAILWASEGGIYQRFGYGLAGMRTHLSIERDRSAFRVPHVPAGTVRFVEADEAKRIVPPLYDGVRLGRPGFFNRTPAWWDHEFFRDPEHWRRGLSQAWYVVHEVAGEPRGYAKYRIKSEWSDAGSKSAVVLSELMALDSNARLDLWRYLLDIDLMARLEAWNVAGDDPILLAVAEPRRLNMGLGDALWLRIVDVASALAGRRYRANGRLVIEVADAFCPWNDGRWVLTIDGGTPTVEPASVSPDLACDVADLAAAYLGAFTFAQLGDAGRIRELQPGGIERADALFRTDRQPWCPAVF